MRRRRRGFVRWFFEDRRTGEIVVGQRPNLLLTAAAGSTLARLACPGARAVRAANVGCLCLFGLDEAVRGVNPFRRVGGAAVLLWAIKPSRR